MRINATCGQCGSYVEVHAESGALAQAMIDRWHEQHHCLPRVLFGHTLDEVRNIVAVHDATEYAHSLDVGCFPSLVNPVIVCSRGVEGCPVEHA